MSLYTYGFSDDVYMEAKSFQVSVSAKDKIIQVMDGNMLLASLSMTLSNNILSLIGKNDMTVAEVTLPQSDRITDTYYDSENKRIVIVVTMTDGTTSELYIDVSDLIMIYEGCNGIEVEGNKIGIKINENSKKYLSVDDYGLGLNVDSLDETYVTDDTLKNYATIEMLNEVKDSLDAYATKDEVFDLRGELASLEDVVNNKVDWTSIATSENPNRKSIVLNNHDTLLGETTSGGTVNIAMVSKWDKVDLGTATLPINLNGSEARPTYNDTMELALVDDIIAASSDFDSELNKETEERKRVDEELQLAINNLEIKHSTDITNLQAKDSEIETSLSNKVDWTSIATSENPNRKSIVLNNHDTILGTATNGQTYNIGMISKWDKVDLGTATLPINLNGSEARPTYNDTMELALVDDITAASDNITIEINNLHDKDDELLELINTEASERKAKDKELEDKIGNIDISEGNLSDEINKLKIKDAEIEEKLSNETNARMQEDTSLANLIDNESKLRAEEDIAIISRVSALETKDSEIETSLSNKVDWTSIATDENPNRKSIVLNNHDTILAKDTSGNTRSVLMISKWDKVDLGTATLPINLNTPKGVRPTVQEAGQSGEEAHKMAYLSDVQAIKDEIISATDDKFVTLEKHEADLSLKSDITYVNEQLSFKANQEDLVNLTSIVDTKQNKLISGENIKIVDDVISCTLDTNMFVIPSDFILPDVGEPNKIYLIPNPNGSGENIITEYYYVNGKWEILGEYKSNVDLTPYVRKDELDALVIEITKNILTNYATHEEVQTECQSQVAKGIKTAVNEANMYTNEAVTKAKDDILNTVNGRLDSHSLAIESNSEEIAKLIIRCDHFDELFKLLTTEHGGDTTINVYTKEESDAKFATKTELVNKVDWVNIDNSGQVITTNTNNDVITMLNSRMENIENQIAELRKLLNK